MQKLVRFLAATASQEAHLSLRSFVCSFVCTKDVFSKNPYTFASWQLGNLETWQPGNSETWQFGNVAT